LKLVNWSIGGRHNSSPPRPTQVMADTKTVAGAAVFTAFVFVSTFLFTAVITVTSGYFNFGEVMVYTTALIAGPYVGGFAGGVGSALSDLVLAPQYAPGTVVIKGIEGYVVGRLTVNSKSKTPRTVFAIVLGGAEMVAGYFFYESFGLRLGIFSAGAEIPFNVLQALVGLIVAVPLVRAIGSFMRSRSPIEVPN